LAVQRAVSSKSTLPVLEGILFNAEDGHLTLSGYDLEIGIVTKIPAMIEKPGAAVIDAKLVSDIVRRMPGGKVSLETDDKNVTILRSDSSEFSVMSFSAEEYPAIPTIDDGEDINIESNVLKSMISQTIFAVAQNDSKPVHTGVLFEIDNENITLVAVDGYRLAMRTEKVSGLINNPISFIVPGKALLEISRLMAGENISIKLGQRHIVFETDSYFIVSRLLEGEFMDYNNAIPKAETTSVTLPVREFSDCIDRISLVITEQDRSPVKCIFDESEVKISCITSKGRASDVMSAEITGDRVEIGANNKFLLDALKAADTDEIKLSMSGSVSPIKIMPKQGNAFTFLVLPVRLKPE